MRNLSASQQASFSNDVLTICSLAEIIVNDGTLVYLTDHDVDLGDYKSSFGLDLSAILMQLGGTGQTATVTMLPDNGRGGGITFGMVEQGLLDSALVKIYWTDYTKSPLDPILVTQGYISECTYGSASLFTFTINTKLSIPVNLCADVLQATCRVDFGSPQCGIDLTNMVDGPHVWAPIDAQSFIMTRDEATPAGYYNNGTLYFQTGANKGSGYEILTVSDPDANNRETVFLKVPIAFDVEQGDYFFLYPGCDKVISSGCTYWNNTVNFQGEPFTADFTAILPPAPGTVVPTSGINTGLPAICNWWLTQYIQTGFGQTITFESGTVMSDNMASGTHTYTGTIIPPDAYAAIYNGLGGSAAVAAFDGTLTPTDQTSVAALVAAGYTVPINLTLYPVTVNEAELELQIETTLLPFFFKQGTDLYNDTAAALGIVLSNNPGAGTIVIGQ